MKAICIDCGYPFITNRKLPVHARCPKCGAKVRMVMTSAKRDVEFSDVAAALMKYHFG